MDQASADQKVFLGQHLDMLRTQTRHARDAATDVSGQVTCDRYLRALDAFEAILATTPDDGDLGAVFANPDRAAVLEALGFEAPLGT